MLLGMLTDSHEQHLLAFNSLYQSGLLNGHEQSQASDMSNLK